MVRQLGGSGSSCGSWRTRERVRKRAERWGRLLAREEDVGGGIVAWGCAKVVLGGEPVGLCMLQRERGRCVGVGFGMEGWSSV